MTNSDAQAPAFTVLADADYGRMAEFRQGLSDQGLVWAVGVQPTQTVYPAEAVIRPRTEMPARCTVSGSPETSGCHQ